MGYFAAYVVLTLASGRDHGHWRSRILRAGSAIIVAAAVCASRIYLAYHTEAQVMIGATVGLLFGVVWHYFLGVLRQQGIITWMLDLPVSKFFYIKDSPIRNKMFIEWQEWRGLRKKAE